MGDTVCLNLNNEISESKGFHVNCRLVTSYDTSYTDTTKSKIDFLGDYKE